MTKKTSKQASFLGKFLTFSAITLVILIVLFLAYLQFFYGGITWYLKEFWRHKKEAHKEIQVDAVHIAGWNESGYQDNRFLVDGDVLYFGSNESRSTFHPDRAAMDSVRDVQNYITPTSLDGSVLWKTELPLNEGVCSTPQLAGNILITPTAKTDLVQVGNLQIVENGLFATKKDTGEKVWHLASKTSDCPAFITDGMGVAWLTFDRLGNLEDTFNNEEYVWLPKMPYDGKLHVVDAATGKQRWATQIDSDTCREIVMHDTMVFTTTQQGNLIAFDKNSGHIVWQKETSLLGCGEMSVQDDYVQVLRREDAGASVSVSRFNAKTGAELLVRNFPGKDGERKFNKAPVISEDMILLTVNDGNLDEGNRKDFIEVYDLNSGVKKWEFAPLPKLLIRSNPFVAGNAVYVALQYEQELYKLDKNTGEVIKKTDLMSGNGPHYFLSHDNKLILSNSYIDVFDLNTLERLWWTKGKPMLHQFDTPVIKERYLYTIDTHGYFYKIDVNQ